VCGLVVCCVCVMVGWVWLLVGWRKGGVPMGGWRGPNDKIGECYTSATGLGVVTRELKPGRILHLLSYFSRGIL